MKRLLFVFLLGSPLVLHANPSASYQQRVAHFHQILSKESGRQAKVAKAISIAKNKKSEYRIDALNFLADTRSKSALDDLFQIAKDSDVREFAIFAIGEIPSEKSVPILIPYLDDGSENVRGNTFQALRKITEMSFLYDYRAASGEARQKGIKDVTQWWKLNEKTFKVREQTPDEKKAAEEAWEKVGKNYVHKLE